MAISKYTVDTHEVAFMRPATSIITEVPKEEEDLEGAIQDKSETTCQLQCRVYN